MIIEPSFVMYLRGRLVCVCGYIDKADPDVGIMCDTFTAYSITILEHGPSMAAMCSPADRAEECVEETLDDHDWRLIDEAYWASRPFRDHEHCVFSWRAYDG